MQNSKVHFEFCTVMALNGSAVMLFPGPTGQGTCVAADIGMHSEHRALLGHSCTSCLNFALLKTVQMKTLRSLSPTYLFGEQ